MSHCNIGVLASPFMRAALVIDVDTFAVTAPQIRPARYYNNFKDGYFSRLDPAPAQPDLGRADPPSRSPQPGPPGRPRPPGIHPATVGGRGTVMQLTVTVVCPAAGRRADVVIDADPGTTVARAAAELDRLVRGTSGPAGPALFVGGHRVPGDMRLADAPVLDGCVVSLGDPAGWPRPEPAGVAELRVAGGPAAGAVYRLGFQAADIGGPGASLADIVIDDPGIPPLALRLIIGRGGGQVAPYDGTEVLLDGQPLDGAAYWRPGQQVAVGSTLLDLVPYEPPDAALHPAEDGAGLEFNRPPRLLPPGGTMRFQLPNPPGKPERRPVPVLMAVVPVVLGVAMAYFLRQVYMLAMAVFSPVMLLGSYVSDRRHGRKSHARQQAEYTRAQGPGRSATPRAAVAAERLRRRHDCPDPATVLSIASGPRRRLWERRRTDPDYLLLRLGTADLPSAVELTDPAADEHRRRLHWLIPDAPVTVPLAERGVAGVAGPGERPGPRAGGWWPRSPALHSPEDVQVCVLTGTSGQAAWEWARWLPHCRPAEGQNCAVADRQRRRDGRGPDRRTDRRSSRPGTQALREQGPGGSARTSWSSSTGPAGSGPCPAPSRILREGPEVGVYSICLDADERLLPAECQAVAAAGPDGTLTVSRWTSPPSPRSGRNTSRPAGPNGWPGRSRRIRDVSGDEEDTGLPGSLPAAGRSRRGTARRRGHRGPLAGGRAGRRTR